MRFWSKVGIDGFRLDAVPYLCEREGTNNENLPETHGVIKILRAVLENEFPDRIFLAEANQWPEDLSSYFGDGDECHMCFHFPLMPRLFMAIADADRYPVHDILRQTPPIPENCQWAVFLRNHDELTLEMVSERERERMNAVYAVVPKMRINVGIRRRLAPLLENDRRRIELMNGLLMSMPGTPVIYYGDEIGMGDNLFLKDRDGVRTPMQWSPDRNGGFSTADQVRLYAPVVTDPTYGYSAVNVESQQQHSTSLLNWMRRLIAVRKAKPHVRTRHADAALSLEPARARVPALVRERHDARRREPRSDGAAGTARPGAVRGADAVRDARVDRVPADHDGNVRDDARAVRLFLVLARTRARKADRHRSAPPCCRSCRRWSFRDTGWRSTRGRARSSRRTSCRLRSVPRSTAASTTSSFRTISIRRSHSS